MRIGGRGVGRSPSGNSKTFFAPAAHSTSGQLCQSEAPAVRTPERRGSRKQAINPTLSDTSRLHQGRGEGVTLICISNFKKRSNGVSGKPHREMPERAVLLKGFRIRCEVSGKLIIAARRVVRATLRYGYPGLKTCLGIKRIKWRASDLLHQSTTLGKLMKSKPFKFAVA